MKASHYLSFDHKDVQDVPSTWQLSSMVTRKNNYPGSKYLRQWKSSYSFFSEVICSTHVNIDLITWLSFDCRLLINDQHHCNCEQLPMLYFRTGSKLELNRKNLEDLWHEESSSRESTSRIVLKKILAISCYLWMKSSDVHWNKSDVK